MKSNKFKRLLIIPAILIGVGIFVIQKKNSSEPVRLPVEERATTVRVISVPQTAVFPHLTATGNVQPSQVWSAVSQVSGKIIELHPRLKKGALIKANEILLKIDPSDYQLAITQAETEIEAAKVQLAQIDMQESNARASLAIERQALKIAESDLKRQKRLLAKNSVSHSEYEKDQRNLLAQKQRAQTYLNSINLYPVERQRLHAELAKLDTQLSIAKLNLERATVTMPFNSRIAEVNVEYQQFVGQGKLMVVADGIDKAEVSVQIPMGRLFNLVHTDAGFNAAGANSTEMGKLLGISARVLLRQNNYLIDWDARVARISGALDPRTRTVGVIIEVDQPYERVQPGKRPPLVKGLFVDVELYGRPHVNSIVIPLSALHDQDVYIVNAENRLERRSITTGISGSDYVVVKDGLKSGEQIVLSYLAPAIDGMLLKTVDDTQALNQLLSSVSGSIKP